MNKKTKSKVKFKNQLYKVHIKKGRNKVDFLNLKNSIAELTELVSTTKRSYYKNSGEKLNDPTIQTKPYWTILKSFHNNKKILLIPLLLINYKLVLDIKTKANIFNKLFAEQCTPLKNDSVLPTSQHVLTQSRLHSIDFSFEEIQKMIKSLDVDKAHGHEDIFIRMITICDSSLVRPLSLLFKKSFDNSYFPELWKKLNITPVHTKNDKRNFENYCPISLLSISSKIFEKIMFYKIYTFLQNE